jgi:hypothetical protein
MEKITQQGDSQFVIYTRYYKGDQIKKDEMGGASSTHGRDKKCVQNFSQKI